MYSCGSVVVHVVVACVAMVQSWISFGAALCGLMLSGSDAVQRRLSIGSARVQLVVA